MVEDPRCPAYLKPLCPVSPEESGTVEEMGLGCGQVRTFATDASRYMRKGTALTTAPDARITWRARCGTPLRYLVKPRDA